MKILLISPSLGVYGGMEAFVLVLADWLRRHTRHEVRVCFKLVAGSRAAGPLVDRCRDLGLDVTFVGRSSPALLRLSRWADVIHGNNCSPDIVFAAKLLRRPLVLTIHNYLRDRVHWRNRLWSVAARFADWRTYNSQFVRDTWEGNSPAPNSEVVPTVSHLPDVEVPLQERRGFYFAARLIANKGLDTLIEAYESAQLDRERWPLVISGGGPLRDWLEQHLAQAGPSGITYLGFVPEHEKALRMASACWLVAPPNTKEDMGLTPIEARNVSVPSIVSRDGGLPESGGPAALICEPGDVDGLRRALETAAGMSSEAYAARCRLARESLQDYLRPMDFYVDLYERLLRARRGHSAMTAS